METKKSYSADLEHQRPTAFLLGLIFALSLIVVGLQYTTQPRTFDDDEDLFDQLTQDLEMKPLDQKDMVSAEPAAPAAKSVTQKIQAVEHTVEQPEKMSPNSNPLLVGDGTGAVAEADVTQALPQTPASLDDEVANVNDVEQLPSFPGGWAAFTKWLNDNLKYPNLARDQKIQGTVAVSMIINRDGTISRVQIAKSVNPLLDREVLRVIKLMPKWEAGKIKGKTVRTMLVVPVAFSL